MLNTTREYPCGCTANGPGDVPNYCPEHGKPQASVAEQPTPQPMRDALDKILTDATVADKTHEEYQESLEILCHYVQERIELASRAHPTPQIFTFEDAETFLECGSPTALQAYVNNRIEFELKAIRSEIRALKSGAGR